MAFSRYSASIFIGRAVDHFKVIIARLHWTEVNGANGANTHLAGQLGQRKTQIRIKRY